MNLNDDEAIGLLNRLLERLHQADLTNFRPTPSPSQKGGEQSLLPEVLATDEAMTLWKKAQTAGWVDANYQPLISRTQSALLADAIAEKLGIRQKWKTFETLWNRKNMYRDYYQALDQRKTLFFRDDIKKVLA